MMTVLLLALITVSEATIGVFVKLVDGRIPIPTLNFYALAFAAAFLALALPWATGQRVRPPRGNVRDTVVIGALIAAQISVFNYAMTLAPIANVVIFWSVAPFFVFVFSALFLRERVRRRYVFIFLLALTGIVLAKPLAGGYMLGNLIALGDGAVYAAMVTYMRYEGKTETGNDIFWSMLVAALLAGPHAVPGRPRRRHRHDRVRRAGHLAAGDAVGGRAGGGIHRLRLLRHLHRAEADSGQPVFPGRHHRVADGGGAPRLPRVRRGAGPRHDLRRRTTARGGVLVDVRDVPNRAAARGAPDAGLLRVE
ncbi:MAG: DMT family transporter [Trueperaceae bacterium]|nr:DMT family transporter [Trueperaceae bacterium]